MKPEWVPSRQNEFPEEGMGDWDPRLDRRAFLKLSSAAVALAGLSACVKPPVEKIFAYVSTPEEMIPGESQYFATHYDLGGFANGLLVESHEGRPTRVDGNPAHPANLGSASAIHQALVLSVYGQNRIRSIAHAKSVSSFPAFWTELSQKLGRFEKSQGRGLAVLSGIQSSDLFSAQKEKLQKKFPRMEWVEYEPLALGNAEKGAEIAFGQSVLPIYDLKRASIILSIDSDFLSHPLSPLVYAKDFAENEAVRLFSLGSSGSLTGAKASFHLSLKPSSLRLATQILHRHLLLKGKSTSRESCALTPEESAAFSLNEVDFLNHLLDVISREDKPVVFFAGEMQSPEIHAVCHTLNLHFSKGAVKFRPAPKRDDHFGISGLAHLCKRMEALQIDSLFILGGNPAYASPSGIPFRQMLIQVPFAVHLSVEENETSDAALWVIPEAHVLESFSDGRAHDGTLSFAQPLIAPLYDGISQSQLLNFLLHQEVKTSLEILKQHYQPQWGPEFANRWKETLRLGFLPGSAHAEVPVRTKESTKWAEAPNKRQSGLELVIREDRKLWDGRFANHPWLQEFPDPLTRLAWGNAVLIHPDDFEANHLHMGEIVEVTDGFNRVTAPALTDPLQARGSITLTLGNGSDTHSLGGNYGVNAYPLWSGNSEITRVQLTSTHAREELACTQSHHSMEGRNLVRTVIGSEAASRNQDTASLYEKNPIPDGEYAWGMSIDLDRCTGCGACVVACQSENNIPVVGKEGVRLGREMHWIRIDRYFEAEPASGGPSIVHFQPVPCMHCEKAPCEPVCPTGATLHGNGGLNQMVYNRCVGTRYCSNNCPYKVRRFNFLTYNDKSLDSARVRNPNVSVRTRGVMEKCTYCVQRISEGRIASARTKKPIADGEIKTACQTTCPSHAIEFGNLNDPSSRVSILKQSRRNYGLLEELGTRPRTTYLAKVIAKDTRR